ncbi:hypothetical protein CSOJ01_05239 [Colletotrichum sojae]|uniref:Uncharacterized protein n=1 Tax=Colletotrichum sojae TaxID=2175907 RepID=A0A8H6JGS2_9PEZI|nr:hypothetical protein CSOJ01_05239 [Colletotrichum sojae]
MLQFNQQSAELSLRSTEESTAMHEMLMVKITASSEAQMKQSLKMQEETLSHISRLSNSLSSIASLVGIADDAYSDRRPPSGEEDNISPLPKNRKRRCSSTDEPHLGTSCSNDIFREIDSHLQAQHIVGRHNFSGCDQGVVFGSFKTFERHLRAVHAASKEALARNTRQLEDLFGDYSSTKRDNSNCSLFSESASTSYFHTLALEPPTADFALRNAIPQRW